MPEEGLFVKFHNGQNQFKVPFVMYADFEAILKPIESPKPNPEESYTKVISQHIPSGFCVYSKFVYGKLENPLKLYRGEECVKVFCDYIENEAKRLHHMFPEKPTKRLTRKERRNYDRATKCHICFIVIILDNVEDLPIVTVIYGIKSQSTSPSYFTT